MAFEQGPFLTLATFCEQVIEDKSGVLSLIRLVDRMYVSAYGPTAPEQMPPTTLNWILILSFKAGKARGSHAIKIEPELPSGLRLQPIILSAYFEGGTRGQNIISKLNMRLEMPGVYWFRIYVEDQFVTQIPVEVIYSRTVTPQPPIPPQQ
jgi:hypothetical protein